MKTPVNILFVSFIGNVTDISRGFVKKDVEKVEALNRLNGASCLGVSFAYEIAHDYYYKPYYFVKKLQARKWPKFFGSIVKRRYEYRELENYLSTARFDIIIARYDVASYSLYKLTKKLKRKILFEHNSFEYDELVLGINARRALLKFSLKPGYFLYYIEGKVWPLFSEKYYGPKVRTKAAAGVAVTNEIAVYQQKLANGYKCRVVTNGVKYDAGLLRKAPVFNEKELRLFMLLGTGAPWHGTDRIIAGLKKYKGITKITIDIIGYYYEHEKVEVERLGLMDNIRFFSPLAGNELDTFIKDHHISIGTLAVHRKNLVEATPLKVRESMMRGYPVMIGYTDPDFVTKDRLNDFIFRVPPTDEPVDFDAVVTFAKAALSVNGYPSLISDLARPKIDFDVKAQETLGVIKECLVALQNA